MYCTLCKVVSGALWVHVPAGPTHPAHHCGGCAAAVVDGLGGVTPCRHGLLCIPSIFHSYCLLLVESCVVCGIYTAPGMWYALHIHTCIRSTCICMTTHNWCGR